MFRVSSCCELVLIEPAEVTWRKPSSIPSDPSSASYSSSASTLTSSSSLSESAGNCSSGLLEIWAEAFTAAAFRSIFFSSSAPSSEKELKFSYSKTVSFFCSFLLLPRSSELYALRSSLSSYSPITERLCRLKMDCASSSSGLASDLSSTADEFIRCDAFFM